MSTLRETARTLPAKPGTYSFRKSGGQLLYVGKAKNLRSRVSSYFNASVDAKTERMIAEAEELDYVVTSNEIEALMLEANLIKKHRPHFNIMLRDDKSYPYLVVTLADKYPRLAVMRRPRIEGAKLYGPYTAKALRKTVDYLRSIFPICTCRTPEKGRGGQCPCLDYHIGRCMAPCLGIDPDEYRKMVDELCLFLEGKRKKILRRLERQMREAAEAHQFERAAILRDRVSAITGMLEGQTAISESVTDADVLGASTGPTGSVIQLLSVREGLLVDSKHFPFPDADTPELVRSFILQFYSAGTPIPPEILLPVELSDQGLLAEWLSLSRGAKVKLSRPVRGAKKKLTLMAAENAEHSLDKTALLETAALKRSQDILEELRIVLGLSDSPRRIECYDISTIGGSASVGAMTVFVDGRPSKSDYRRFQIRRSKGMDDVGMMREVLSRRLLRVIPEGSSQKGDSFHRLPDLIVIDGGIGQVNAAKETIDESGLSIPTIGLAKRLEELFLPGRPNDPIMLPAGSGALRLLQHLRDEAHRFAVDYHRTLRARGMTRSVLDSIPGVGPERRKALLRHYSSLDDLASSTEEEVVRTARVSRSLAREIIRSVSEELKRSRAGAG